MSEASPVFLLDLELLLLTTIIFLAFLIRWYLNASNLSDPAGALGAPRRLLNKKRRENTCNPEELLSSGPFLLHEALKVREPNLLKSASHYLKFGAMWHTWGFWLNQANSLVKQNQEECLCDLNLQCYCILHNLFYDLLNNIIILVTKLWCVNLSQGEVYKIITVLKHLEKIFAYVIFRGEWHFFY